MRRRCLSTTTGWKVSHITPRSLLTRPIGKQHSKSSVNGWPKHLPWRGKFFKRRAVYIICYEGRGGSCIRVFIITLLLYYSLMGMLNRLNEKWNLTPQEYLPIHCNHLRFQRWCSCFFSSSCWGAGAIYLIFLLVSGTFIGINIWRKKKQSWLLQSVTCFMCISGFFGVHCVVCIVILLFSIMQIYKKYW